MIWYFPLDYATYVYGSLYYSALNDSPNYLRTSQRRSIYDFRIWGCYFKALKGGILTNLEDRSETGYFMGTTATRSVIRYWHQRSPRIVGYCTTTCFNERSTLTSDDKIPYGSMFSQNIDESPNIEVTEVNYQQHPILHHPIHTTTLTLSQLGQSVGLTLRCFPYFYASYIKKSSPNSPYYNATPTHLRSNVWILSIADNDPVITCLVVEDLHRRQLNVNQIQSLS